MDKLKLFGNTIEFVNKQNSDSLKYSQLLCNFYVEMNRTAKKYLLISLEIFDLVTQFARSHGKKMSASRRNQILFQEHKKSVRAKIVN